MTDTLPIDRFKAKLGITDSLPSQLNRLSVPIRDFMIAGHVEGKSPRTMEGYDRVFRDFLTFLGDRTSTTQEIRLFLLEQQSRGIAPATVHIYYRNLHAFFNWMVSEEIIKRSPMANIKAPALPRVIIPTFTDDELRRIFLVCSWKRFVDHRNKAMVCILLDTGVRMAELQSITLDDVYLDSRLIKVRGKGDKERLVPYGERTEKAILAYIALRDDAYREMWLGETRTPLSLHGVKSAIRHVMNWAEIKRSRRGAHTFRHTMAITYLRNGGDVFTLQKILGHTTLEMTQRYARVLVEDIVRVHKKASPVDNLRLK